ncbi:hypothetical protein BHE74_00001360, partial [Ensete ventricosum]
TMQQRQTSILAFLRKPSAENRRCDGPSPFSDVLPGRHFGSTGAEKPSDEPFPEIRGTDTPPEKPCCQVFTAVAPEIKGGDSRGANTFSSIMRKFVKEDKSEGFRKGYEFDLFVDLGNQEGSGSFIRHSKSNSAEKSRVRNEMPSDEHSETHTSIFKEKCDETNLHFGPDSDVLGPETPATRPLVPHFKRVQEGLTDFNDKQGSLLVGSGKRLKSDFDSVVGKHIQGEVCESASSKFDWLNPSNIRDANGRRPSDPLYDRRTLYIPPDALKKMSASQRQYWSVKCQYMDLVLFFKVVSSYIIYNYVGISEAGIDDAVLKLTARGYKVGRMEQLETSEQAKARGATSVIQRTLVSVSTPCTPIDGSIGLEAVHLLALKEFDDTLRNGELLPYHVYRNCLRMDGQTLLNLEIFSNNIDGSLSGT